MHLLQIAVGRSKVKLIRNTKYNFKHHLKLNDQIATGAKHKRSQVSFMQDGVKEVAIFFLYLTDT